MSRALTQPIDFDDLERPANPVEVPMLDLDALGHEYDTALPPHYSEFMNRVGPGTYLSEVCVYPLAEVRKVTDGLRDSNHFTKDASLWDNTADMLSPDEAKRVVILGHSLSGDWIGFVGGAPERILVFPRHQRKIVDVGPTFAHALAAFSDA